MLATGCLCGRPCELHGCGHVCGAPILGHVCLREELVDHLVGAVRIFSKASECVALCQQEMCAFGVSERAVARVGRGQCTPGGTNRRPRCVHEDRCDFDGAPEAPPVHAARHAPINL